jgi:hypothetical protein
MIGGALMPLEQRLVTCALLVGLATVADCLEPVYMHWRWGDSRFDAYGKNGYTCNSFAFGSTFLYAVLVILSMIGNDILTYWMH